MEAEYTKEVSQEPWSQDRIDKALVAARDNPEDSDSLSELSSALEKPTQVTQYSAIAKDPVEGRWDPPGAMMTVHSLSPYPHYSSEGMHLNETEDEPRLFHMRSPAVDYMRSDPSMTAHVPTLLGLALNDHGRLQAPASLSRHSARLVQKGVEAGVVDTDPRNHNAKPNNNMGLAPYSAHTYGDEVAVPQEDVARARSTIRSLIRRTPKQDAPKPILSSQFHPQLPGMEDQ